MVIFESTQEMEHYNQDDYEECAFCLTACIIIYDT